MSRQHSRRGRPKGSGLDDRKRLETIAELISADPSLKPTTAIKSLGVTNPSTIRRLRDKYNAFQKSAAGDVKLASDKPKAVADTSRSNGHVQSPAHAAANSGPTAACQSAKSHTGQLRSMPTVEAGLAVASIDEAKELLAEPVKWLGMMCEIGMHGVSSAMMINASACKSFVALPQVKWFCHNQIAVNQMMLDMFRQATHPATSTVH